MWDGRGLGRGGGYDARMASGIRQASEAAPWYRRAFESLYPLIYRHRDDESAAREVAGLRRTLDLDPPARVLDVGCGTGRHMAAFGDAGFDVFGMDLSMTLLRQAVGPRDGDGPERRGRGLAGRLVSADMRAVPFDAAFDLTVNLFTSFGYFEEEEANVTALRSMASTLRRKGRLVLDHMNRPYVERYGQGEDEREVDGLTVRSRRRVEGNRVVKRMTVTDAAGRSTRIDERVRLYGASEMRAMFEAAGLEATAVYGTFDGEGLSEASARMITIGARR